MKVAVTGASGFIGSRLVRRLQEEGHSVLVLTRSAERGRRVFPESVFKSVEVVEYQPLQSGAWQRAIAGCDGVVNLAGEPIAEHRWTPDVKRSILESRKIGTQKIVEAIAQADPKPQVLVNTSAVGFYGTNEMVTFDEDSPSGNDFLAEVCREWEAEAHRVKDSGVRLVILRFGIVLGVEGGALAKMLTPFRLFAGGPLGSGQQWVSWIHREDVVNLILKALTAQGMQGTYNATAPNPVRMGQLAQTLGEVMYRPSWLPVPSFAIEALLGEGAKMVLEGQRVVPKRTLESGFDFQYPQLKPALENLVK